MSAKLTAAVQAQFPAASTPPGRDLVPLALTHLEARFDTQRGGFGGAPKFPQPPTLELLLRIAAVWPDETLRARAMAMLTKTLDIDTNSVGLCGVRHR